MGKRSARVRFDTASRTSNKQGARNLAASVLRSITVIDSEQRARGEFGGFGEVEACHGSAAVKSPQNAPGAHANSERGPEISDRRDKRTRNRKILYLS